ncbi:cytochrome P450 2C11-like [Liasis olivaceus]
MSGSLIESDPVVQPQGLPSGPGYRILYWAVGTNSRNRRKNRNQSHSQFIRISYFCLQLTEKYGTVFTVWMGPKPLVVLCGYEVVKDALVDHAEEFGGHPDVPFDERVTKGQASPPWFTSFFVGILSKNEAKWRELRRFTLSTLRNFGMGKTAMSRRVQEEPVCLAEEMATRRGPLWSSLFQRKPKEKWLLRLLSELGWTLIWKTPTSECKFIVLSWVIEVSSDGPTLPSFSLLGKWAYPGEALARVELSLFLSTLLQTFTFQLVGDTNKDGCNVFV